MKPGPDPYARALADLDELLRTERFDLERRLIESERRFGELRGAAQSLANAVLNALRHGDIVNDSTSPCSNALRQWQLLDQ